MMQPRLGVVVLVLLTVGCDRDGGTNSISGPDAARQRPPAATAADLAGQWRVAAIYRGQSRAEDFLWTGGSPLGLEFLGDRLQVVTPCVVCEAPLGYEAEGVVNVAR